MREVEVFDQGGEVVALRVASERRKVTAERLRKVEEIQKLLVRVAWLVDEIVEEEYHGWVPGSPQTARTERVEPLESLSESLLASVDLLERIYS